MPISDPEARREYQKKLIANRRAEYFEDKVCVVCGSTENLELDHIDSSQKVEHRIWSWSAERRQVELDKCQILCLKHHQEKTRRDNPYTHGITGYKYRMCRCDICTAAKSAENKLRYK
jgi:5-methylcytosine-specific restriction endonuclease McrA